jgi:hypothetical protein
MRADKAMVNRILMTNGLGGLNDPGLVPQLGFLMGRACRDHDQFREVINKCAQAERGQLYEAMRPYLKFPPKPLDVYIAELGMIAEAKQLPVAGENGALLPFKVPEIKMDYPSPLPEVRPFADAAKIVRGLEPETRESRELGVAQRAIAEAVAKVFLELVCASCTRTHVFPGITRHEALRAARDAGWRYDARYDTELCPDCTG